MQKEFDYYTFRLMRKFEKNFDVHKIRLIELFVLAQLLDLLTTATAIVFFGAREVNPVLKNFSLIQLSFVKIIAIYIITSYLFVHYTQFSFWIIRIFATISLLPVVWNIFVIIIEAIY